tara:strand:- start:1044 stop:1196 length:153 start_codon:yes stop_codon:yes gene_type:complete
MQADKVAASTRLALDRLSVNLNFEIAVQPQHQARNCEEVEDDHEQDKTDP